MIFPSALLLSLLSLPSTLAASPPPPALHTATLHHHPTTPTPSTPQPLAILTYTPDHPHLSTLHSFTPPANTSDTSALTSVVVYLDGHTSSVEAGGGGGYGRSTVTATYGFHAPYQGRFRVVLGTEGEVVGASWHSYLVKEGSSVAGGKGNGKGKGESGRDGRGDFDVLTTKSAPVVVFDKPAKGKGPVAGAGTGAGMAGKEGEEEVVEKTLLQKYWWVLLGVAVLAMTGGGDK